MGVFILRSRDTFLTLPLTFPFSSPRQIQAIKRNGRCRRLQEKEDLTDGTALV